MIRFLNGRTVLAGAVLFGGLVVGAVGGSVAIASDSTNVPTGAASTHWQKNARGQTFGSGLNAASPEDEPDLIEAFATNGNLGYVLRTDLEPADPKTPEEALQRQAGQVGKDEVVPVYAADGATKIGVFVITHHAPAKQKRASDQ